jgi:hypothetical protein
LKVAERSDASGPAGEAEALEDDDGRYLGFVRIVARRRGESETG